MLKRIITGACYVAVLVAFFLLRELVDYRIFNILIYAFTVIGTVELVKMLKPFSVEKFRALIIAYSVVAPLLFLAIEYFLFKGFGYLGVIAFALLCFAVIAVYFIVTNTEKDKFLPSVLGLFYPMVFMTFALMANELEHGFIALVCAFVISPVSDTFAYFTGMAIGGKKLCPKISPKKTWAGAIGGTVGGAISALLVYFIFNPQISFSSPVLFFVVLGLVASVVNIFGDLFESIIKRKAGVKDSGKILPGHGGVLDRIDGTMFVMVIVYFAFLIVG